MTNTSSIMLFARMLSRFLGVSISCTECINTTFALIPYLSLSLARSSCIDYHLGRMTKGLLVEVDVK